MTVQVVTTALGSIAIQRVVGTGADSDPQLQVLNGAGTSNFAVTGAGVVVATTFIGALYGNASTVTTNANLTGDVTSVGNATSLPGAWTTFTPTWTSTGTAPALGNGTLTGSYIRLGKTINARVKLTIGSTTTLGTGTYSFALPATALAAFPLKTMIGIGYIENLGIAGFQCFVRMDNVNKVQLEAPNTTTDTRLADVAPPAAGINHPIPFATGDFVAFTYTYEIA